LRRADRACDERTIVAGVIPGKRTAVVGLGPEGNGIFDRFDRLLAVEDDGLPICFDLLAAPRPQIGVPEIRRIAKSMGKRLPVGTLLGLELLPNSLYSSHVWGKFSAVTPTSANQEVRLTSRLGTIVCGIAIHLSPSVATVRAVS
jgi:hypothetical protein